MSMSLQETAVPAPDDVKPPRRSTLFDPADAAVPWWEWAFAGLALFVLARTPVLFVRLRTGDLVGGPITTLQWRDDPYLVHVFLTVQLGALVLALRRCSPKTLLAQPLVLSLVALAWVSTAWSVEPATTQMRALGFAGTIIVGWYIGARWSLRGQVQIVAAVGAVGAAISGVLLVFWWDYAQATLGNEQRWHGIFGNANHLGWAMALAIVATVVVALDLRGRRRAVAAGVIVVEGVLLAGSASVTAMMALVAGVGAMAAVGLVRRLRPERRLPVGGAIVAATSALVGVIVLARETLLEEMGRSSTLSGRTDKWDVGMDYFGMKPWRGWGFDAIWVHQPFVEESSAQFGGRYGWAFHNGYLEMLVGVGLVGLALLVAFLGLTAWRAVAHGMREVPGDIVSLWLIAAVAFVVAINFGESFITSNEPLLAVVVAVAVVCTRTGHDGSNPRRPAETSAVDGDV